MKKFFAVSCFTILAMTMLLPVARTVNAASVDHTNWAKSGPGPGPWFRAGFVQPASTKSGPGPGPWLTLGSNF